MDNETITALAREYAEENAKSIRDTFGLPERAYYTHRDEDEKSFERVIRFLLRRFCLVEKEAVRKEYREAKICRTHLERFSAQWGAVTSKMAVLERLFPEIAKEVEG